LGQSAALQGECRIPEKIFRYGEVFNTSVDKFVENSRPRTANFSFFNVLARFAQYLCNRFHIESRKKSRTNAWYKTCWFETKRYAEIVASTATAEILFLIVWLFVFLLLCLV
jgi:hypothetical protein